MKKSKELSLVPPASSGATLLTENDVAKLLRISVRQAQRLPIPFVNLGTKTKQLRRFRPADVENWLSQRVKGA